MQGDPTAMMVDQLLRLLSIWSLQAIVQSVIYGTVFYAVLRLAFRDK
jgi:hypothetical protein